MAEKFLALASLGIDNSRMKDFYDMIVMFRLFEFDSALLARAIKNTFKARKFEVTADVPVALTKEFYENPEKTKLWNGFSRRAGLTMPVGKLDEVIIELGEKLAPVLEMIKKVDYS